MSDLNKKIVIDFLQNMDYCMLASSVDGEVSAAVMYYQFDEDFNFYFLMKSNTEKFKNILKNNKVALVVSDDEKWLEVQLKGKAELLSGDDFNERLEGFLKALEKKMSYWAPPPLVLRGEDFKVVKIVPTWLRYADFKRMRDSNGGGFIQVIE